MHRHHSSVLFALILLLGSFPKCRVECQAVAAVGQDTALSPDMAEVEKRIVVETNQFRSKVKRGQVTVNAELTRAARYLADYMAKSDKYSHTADGKQPGERAKEHGYDYCVIAENIAWQLSTGGFTSQQLADSLVTGWKNSPEHRKNMLDADVLDIGVAVTHSDKTGRYYAVQEFGRPRSKAITFQISNESGGTVRYTVDDQPFTLEARYKRTHEACRPPKLVIVAPSAAENSTKGGEVFHPEDGARYVIRKRESGGYVVEAPSSHR